MYLHWSVAEANCGKGCMMLFWLLCRVERTGLKPEKSEAGPGQPFAGAEGERAGPPDLHEKRRSLGRESGAGSACGSHLFVNGIQPLALGTDWRQFANVCAWLGACSSLCPGGTGGLIGKPERVIPDCQSLQAVTWRATFQTISNMNIQGWAYSSSRHWFWLIPHAVFQTLLL